MGKSKTKQKRKKLNWRRLFSYEYQPADYGCEDVWIRSDQYRLVKFPSSLKQEGKWGVFTPLDKFLGRCSSKTPPFEWADQVIIELVK